MSGECGDGSSIGRRAAKVESFEEVQFLGFDLFDMSTDVLVKLFPARARRRVYCNERFQRGLKRNRSRNCVKLYILSMMSTRFFGGLEQKMEVPDGEKPLRTHLRNMIILH